MAEQKIDVKSFVEGVFSAENQSAASLSEQKLGKYNNIAVKMFHTGVLTSKEMLIPAFADLASKILQGVNTYRKLYFVNVLKIDLKYVLLIELLIGIYDVLNNPLMGAAYDHTRTRWGKARPYILFSTAPFFIVSAMLYFGAIFLGTNAGDDPRKIVFVFVMLFLQETFSTIYGIPRGSMLSLQTANPKDRIKVGLLQEYIGGLGTGAVYALFMPLMELNNKGYIHFPAPYLFATLAAVAAVFGIIGNMSLAIHCKERILLQPKPAPLTKTIFYILKNKYMLRNFIAGFATSWWADGGYSWDIVTQQEIYGGTIFAFLVELPQNIINPLSVTFIPKFQKFFKNNRDALITLRLWDLACTVLMVTVGVPFVHNRLVVCLICAFCLGLNAANNGPANVFEAEVNREINDYTEYVTGERPDGTIGLLTGLLGKVTAPLNTVLSIALMKWSGYDTTLPQLPWIQGSLTVYRKVFFLYRGIHIIPTLVHVIPYFFYDLVGEKREKMYIALNERRALMANEHSENEDMIAELATALSDSVDG
ncbi:MAG: MFS transporter [Clostridia bacterium]|nr:MFS transporter [Clostridia bacterium]